MLAQFRRWLDANSIGLLPQAPLAKAFGYALRHWEALGASSMRRSSQKLRLPIASIKIDVKSSSTARCAL
ncbi:hypothetical protein KRI00_35690 [Paraburkholderia fungorum]|nr:hypothetical protein [Paraburkholderia fungorum]